MKRVLHMLGEKVLSVLQDLGGLARLFFAMFSGVFKGRMDRVEFWRSLYRVGVRSFVVVAITSVLVGGITAIQTAGLVSQFGATTVVGGATGITTLREIGPILIGLMFSGRVGANNTAELGTMAVTEQIDALRTLAIDPVDYLLAPRYIAIVIMMVCLTIIGGAIAIVSASGVIYLLMGLDPRLYYASFEGMIEFWDFFNGVCKAVVFGASIALVSNYYGMKTQGGAVGVGRSVNAAVVASAVSIFLFDYILTATLP